MSFQEIKQLEGELSPSHAAQIKRLCQTEGEYLAALKVAVAASREAIARVRRELGH